MPEVTVTYEKPETIKILKEISKYLGFTVSASAIRKNKETTIVNGATMKRKSDAGKDGLHRINEHEIVMTTDTIAAIPKGTSGTVVHIYADGKAYEVEFIIKGKSIVETALSTQIKKI